MAIFTPSALVSEIRGSVGTNTFSRNGYGNYVKQKILQVNPDTAFQQVRRSAYAEGVAAWQSMSESLRVIWKSYVSEMRRQNRLAVPFRRSAYLEVLSRYLNRSLIEGTNENFLPTPTVLWHPWLTSASIVDDELLIHFDSVANVPGTRQVIYATAPLKPSITSINPSLANVIDHSESALKSGTFNITEAYLTRYGLTSIPGGRRIGIAMKSVNNANYAESAKTWTNVVSEGSSEFPFIFDETFDQTFD